MMKILVAGLINIETTLKVDAFPVTYAPVRYPFFGVTTTVAGVGYNITKALKTLGDDVRFLSLIGHDLAGDQVITAIEALNVSSAHIVRDAPHTAQSVILYDAQGKRAIFTDLKDLQERTIAAEQAFDDVQCAVICNINFARGLLGMAQAAGVPIATDVHAISAIDDDYNQDYMAAADILFQSHENLPTTPQAWTQQIGQRYDPAVVVVGCGAQGAILRERGASAVHVPAVHTRPIVNTVGAGDALFSAFVHGYMQSGHAHDALKQAVVFASYKIGVAGAADGFLTAAELAAQTSSC